MKVKIHNKSKEMKADQVVLMLDNFKVKYPDAEMIIETPKGSLTCKLKDALIYTDCESRIVIDSE